MPRDVVTSVRMPNLRIIGGEWRSRRLRLPSGTQVRPTPNRVRETVFNWLAPRMAGARCVDLYAGSGALGFEALSRGAAEAVFVEHDRRLVAALEQNARALGARARIVAATAAQFLRESSLERFDIAFVDPPYAIDLGPLLGPLSTLLSATALVYVERSKEQGLPALEGLSWYRTACAGSVCFGLASLDHA